MTIDPNYVDTLEQVVVRVSKERAAALEQVKVLRESLEDVTERGRRVRKILQESSLTPTNANWGLLDFTGAERVLAATTPTEETSDGIGE